jgi:hypothetical protein
MVNPKISGIAAGAGFVLSLLVGLVTGARFPLLLIRAFVFAAVFFALASAGYGAMRLYLPELFDSPASAPAPLLGGQVDISIGGEDDSGEISLESGGLGDGLNDFLENPGNSVGGALDQTGEAVYTEEGAADEMQGRPALPGESGFASEAVDSVDMLPDLDAMSGAFGSEPIPVGGGGESAGTSPLASSFDSLDGFGGQPKKAGLDDEFNVKEMASAIQTILKRESKG